MARIFKYDLDTMFDLGTANYVDYVDANDYFSGNNAGEGLVHIDGKLYHIAGGVGYNAVQRLFEGVSPPDMSVELSVVPSSAPDDFLNPTFATIVFGGATLVSLYIDGLLTVAEGSATVYKAMALWSDSTSSEVVANSWYISPSSPYATINGFGVLSAGLVKSNKYVTINATYMDGGTTYTASKVITILDVPTPITILGSDVSILESLNYDQKLLYWTAHKVLGSLLDLFTPKMRYQYQDSVLFKSYVQAMAEELAVTQLQIKQAMLQLNFQEAVSIFLNLWTQIVGIKKLEGESDVEYKNRILGDFFIDKISNSAIRRALLIKYGFSSAVVDTGKHVSYLTYDNFDSGQVKAKLLSNYYSIALDGTQAPNETLDLLYEDAMDMTALGNIIMSVSQVIDQDLEDPISIFGTFYENPGIYGETYFQHDASSENGISFVMSANGDLVNLDNQRTMPTNTNDKDYKLFDRNVRADDYVIITDVT
jgi:hypothetical protein